MHTKDSAAQKKTGGRNCPKPKDCTTAYVEPTAADLECRDELTRYGRSGDPAAHSCINKDVVMTSNGILNVMPSGVLDWTFDRTDIDAASFRDTYQLDDSVVVCAQNGGSTNTVAYTPPAANYVEVHAYWQNDDLVNARGISMNVGNAANIFGGVGMLRVKFPASLSIPKVRLNTSMESGIGLDIDTLKAMVRFYGAELIELNQGNSYQVASANKMVLMAYTYEDNYVADFLTQPCGGGGYFVERHDFPHIHIPMEDSSKGFIVLGKPMAVCSNTAADPNDPDSAYTLTRFAFTAFNIPYGYALYSPSNTIHGDGTLLGKYAISVADSDTPADTVLFYGYDQSTSEYHALSNVVE